MITYQLDTIKNVLLEGTDLLIEHYEESEVFKDKIALNPNIEQYMQMFDSDNLIVVSVRDTGILVGYTATMIFKSLHYKDHIFAQNDAIFVRKSHRKGMVGVKLIKFTENELRKLGVTVHSINSKVHSPFFSVLEKLGYVDTEHKYSKYIGEYNG